MKTYLPSKTRGIQQRIGNDDFQEKLQRMSRKRLQIMDDLKEKGDNGDLKA